MSEPTIVVDSFSCLGLVKEGFGSHWDPTKLVPDAPLYDGSQFHREHEPFWVKMLVYQLDTPSEDIMIDVRPSYSAE